MGDKLRRAAMPAAVTAAVLVLPATGAAGGGELDAEVERRPPIARLELLGLGVGSSVDEAVSELKGRPEVAYAEPNFLYRSTAIPDDPLFPTLWGLDNTGQTGGTPDADID